MYTLKRCRFNTASILWSSVVCRHRLLFADRTRILVQVTIYCRLWIGRVSTKPKPTIYRNLYENTGLWWGAYCSLWWWSPLCPQWGFHTRTCPHLVEWWSPQSGQTHRFFLPTAYANQTDHTLHRLLTEYRHPSSKIQGHCLKKNANNKSISNQRSTIFITLRMCTLWTLNIGFAVLLSGVSGEGIVLSGRPD